MRGQFFIIAAAIIISVISLLFQYFWDFSKISYVNTQFTERNYIYNIRDDYIAVLNSSLCDQLPAELDAVASKYKMELMKRSILFNASYTYNCGNGDVTINFNLTSQKFKSSTFVAGKLKKTW